MKKLLAILIGLAILGGTVTSVSAADIPDEQWTQTSPTEAGGSWGIAMTDDLGLESPVGYLVSIKSDTYQWGSGKQLAIRTCSSFPSANCPSDEYQEFTTPVGLCSSGNDYDCVDQILAEKADGTKLPYTFVRSFPETNQFAFSGNKESKLPKSGNSFIVDIPGAPHVGGSLYYIAAILGGNRMPSQGTFNTNSLRVSINAVTFQSGSYSTPTPIIDLNKNGTFPSVGRAGDPRCNIQCSNTEIALGQAMPLDIKFGISMRLNAKVTGWLNGRVSKVDSKISIDSDGLQNIQVIGYPVKVPLVFGWTQKSTAPQAIKEFYGTMTAEQVNGGNGYGKCLDPTLAPDAPLGPCKPIYWESVLRRPGKNLQALQEVAAWLPYLKDTSVVAPTRWNISSLENGSLKGCYADSSRLSGIVTTNATGFVSGPPDFNTQDQTLEYKVLAPHFLNDGTVFKGTYDLAIDSNFARCIYGFTNAPVSASISIVSTDGSNQVATVVTSEHDGWIHLGAYGFTFSSPTLKVKLTQEKPVVATPTPSAAPAGETKQAAGTAMKQTITCVKGKLTKKVTATSPKCPTGYKKKA
jgi:hypothetical protein